MAPTRIVGDCCCGLKYPVSIEITGVDFDYVYVYFGEWGDEDEVTIFQINNTNSIRIQAETRYSDGTAQTQEWRVPQSSYSSASAFYYNSTRKTLVFLLPVIETTVGDKTYRTVATNLTRSMYGRTDVYPASAYWIISFADSDATQTGTEDGYPMYANIPWDYGTEENYAYDKHTALFEVVEPGESEED